MLEEVKKETEGECCACLQKLLRRNLLALVPCGHRCVRSDDAAAVVGQACPMYRAEVREAIVVFGKSVSRSASKHFWSSGSLALVLGV